MRNRARRQCGVSLVELIVVVAIMVIVMAMVITTMARIWRVLESWRA